MPFSCLSNTSPPPSPHPNPWQGSLQNCSHWSLFFATTTATLPHTDRRPPVSDRFPGNFRERERICGPDDGRGRLLTLTFYFLFLLPKLTWIALKVITQHTQLVSFAHSWQVRQKPWLAWPRTYRDRTWLWRLGLSAAALLRMASLSCKGAGRRELSIQGGPPQPKTPS